MTTQAKIGYGVLFKLENDASPQTFVTIGEILGVKPPSISRDTVDATHSESTEGYREFIPGLKDGGEVSFDMHLIPGSTGTTLLLSQLGINTASACKISLPTSPAYDWSFDAILTSFEPDAPIDDKMVVAVTFKVTGKPVLAAAS
jgi:predicted secreted protein